MNFKSSLFVCALHMFTAVWSGGLTESFIDSIIGFTEKYRLLNEVPRIVAVQYLMDFGFRRLTTVFPSEEIEDDSGLDDKTLPVFLIALSDLDKENDDWQENSMTTYEVNIFVKMFNVQDSKGVPDGLLTRDELVKLFPTDLTLGSEVDDKIKNEFKKNNPINAVTFLAKILKHKPQVRKRLAVKSKSHYPVNGNGLDKEQIIACIPLYDPFSNELNRTYQQQFYGKLTIVSDAHKDLMEFEHAQPASFMLQEFLVFWAEHNKEDHGESQFFTTSDIRDYLYEFNRFDSNLNGLLEVDEFMYITNLYFKEDDNTAVFNEHTDDKPAMNAAMFLKMKYYLVFERKPDQPNDMANENVEVEQ